MQKLRFLHIPKTAGTTFAQVLINQYKFDDKFQFTGDIKSDTKRFNELSDEEKQQITLYYGHAPIKTKIESIDKIQQITFLRGPVNRVKSFCQHASEGKSAYLRKMFPKGNFDLDKFLNFGILELSNLQTKMLVNQGASAITLTMSHDKALELALDNLLNKMPAFGIVEYFDESLILFKQKFNWNLPLYTSKNVKDKSNLLTFEPRHIKKIAQLNQLDTQLFLKAREVLIERINDKSFDKKALKKLRKINNPEKDSITQLKSKIIMKLGRVYNKVKAKK